MHSVCLRINVYLLGVLLQPKSCWNYSPKQVFWPRTSCHLRHLSSSRFQGLLISIHMNWRDSSIPSSRLICTSWTQREFTGPRAAVCALGWKHCQYLTAHFSRWIVDTIKEACDRADLDVDRVRAHEVRAISASWAYLNQILLDCVLAAALWRSQGPEGRKECSRDTTSEI